MSDTLKIDGHTEEAKKLRMFPFTLAEEDEEWFYSLPAESITTWEEMEKVFLNEYFPASVFLRKRYEILNFKQKDGETLGDAYKRFKIIMVACPTHNMNATEQMQMFVNGLKVKTKQLIDTAAGDSTNFSTTTGIKKIIEAITTNKHMELYDRCQRKPEGVIDLKLETNKIHIEDTIVAEVDKKLKAMNIGTQPKAQVGKIIQTSHGKTKKEPLLNMVSTKLNINNNSSNMPPKKADWEIVIERMASHYVQFQEETRKNQKNTTASIKNLEVQIGQIAQQLASSS
ncbi:uncharacterized protein LOC127136767 [Lathyrus oleraceus]|uniref:uncharacterized protein LOC127136767 n=1 Tax=Pisum sativum TaxID=3888 RepID=UPI0021D0749A|nr:uncharacterized protein LOC127136767 [Pisum sativum]